MHLQNRANLYEFHLAHTGVLDRETIINYRLRIRSVIYAYVCNQFLISSGRDYDVRRRRIRAAVLQRPRRGSL